MLLDSTMFENLGKVFDQFKINAIRVKLVPIAFNSLPGANL